MRQNKKRIFKVLSILLSITALVCLFAALIILLKGAVDDRRSEEILNGLRPSTEDVHKPIVPSSEPSSSETVPSESKPEESKPSESKQEESKPSESKPGESKPEESKPAEPESTQPLPSESEPEETGPAPIENPYAESFLANKDMAAWLQIPGTVIDYPVMWTPTDENHYLYRDFNGKDNKNGCLILDTDSCVNPLTTNLIIHGHNMKSGAMFGDLTEYEKKAYYENHKEIILYTPECQRNYEVIAVFRSQVYRKSDQVFKFYQFFEADTEEEFDYFYKNIKDLSLYDTGVTATFGDNFITLSTCVYHVENGRFVVIAKETESGDSYLPLTD